MSVTIVNQAVDDSFAIYDEAMGGASDNTSLIGAEYGLENETSLLRGYGCAYGWREENHVVFQVAKIFVLMGFAAPNTMLGNMFLHGLLTFGFLLESAWAWVILCAPDIFSWNFCFMAVNLIQLLYILYQLKPVKFLPELDEVYSEMFEPLGVPRHVFKRLTGSAYASLSSLHVGEAYAVQNVTRADKLGLLISGKASVYYKQQLLHNIEAMQFMDSPEFDVVTACEEKYQASIIATEPCEYILWSRSNLSYLFVKESYLSHIMSNLIARDITNKLYQLNDRASAGQGGHKDIRLPPVAEFLSGVPKKHGTTDQFYSPVTDTFSDVGSCITGISTVLSPVESYLYTNGSFVNHQTHQPTSVSNDDFSRLGRCDSKTSLV